MVMSIVTASRRQPKILGKPETFMFEAVAKDFPDIKPERTLMIGDKYVKIFSVSKKMDIFYCFFFLLFSTKTDILLGKNCGLKTLMVGSGVDSIQEANRWKNSLDSSQEEKNRVPDFTVSKLGDLLPLTNQF